MAGYNAATGEQNASMNKLAGVDQSALTSQGSLYTAHGSSRKELPMTNSKNTATTQVSRNSKAGAARQSHECLAFCSPDHKIRRCHKKRNIYVRNNIDVLTNKLIKDALNNELEVSG